MKQSLGSPASRKFLSCSQTPLASMRWSGTLDHEDLGEKKKPNAQFNLFGKVSAQVRSDSALC